MQLSPSDLALIKSQPQEFNLFLNIYQPETLLAGQINGVVSRNDRDIPIGNITTGSLSGVPDNFLMMIGSTPGASDQGTIRARFVSGTHIIVAENNDIEWTSGQYITILNYIDVDAVYPRIIQKPNNPEDVIFLKDYDIVYTNQNSILGTFINMGPHRAAFRDPATGLAQLYWSASGTYNVNGVSLTYSWEFEGATVTGSTSETPGWRNYDHTGDFRTCLTVTSSEGAVDKSYRFVSIRDRPEAGPNPPILKWEITQLQGSRNEAGYTARVRFWEPIDRIRYLRDGALVVIFSDDYYAGTRKNLGGNTENCSEIFFVGYILKGTIMYDYKEGVVEFDVGSVTEMMKLSQGFSVSCQDDKSPDTWYKIKDLTITKAIYHYLRWHSTVLSVADFRYLDAERAVQYFDSDRESLYDAVQKFLTSGLKAEMVCDRQGKLWAQLDAANTYQARTAFPVALSISKNDWGSNPPSNASTNAARAGGSASSPNITERLFPETSFLEYGGIAYIAGAFPPDPDLPNYTGPGHNISIPMLSNAPGQAPGYKGGVDQQEGLILVSQTGLNRMTGAAFAYANSRYPEVTFSMAGAYKNLDLAPIECIQLNVDAADTPQGIVFANEPFHLTGVEWSYSPQTKSLIQTPHFAQLVNGLDGETVLVPPPPKDKGNGVPGTQIPPFGFGLPTPTGTHGVYGIYNHFGVGWHDSSANSLTNQTLENGVTITQNIDGNGTHFGLIEMTPGSDGIYQVNFAVYQPGAAVSGPNIVEAHLHVGPAGDLPEQMIIQGMQQGQVSPLSSNYNDMQPVSLWAGMLRSNPGDRFALTVEYHFDAFGANTGDVEHFVITFSIFKLA